MFPRSFVVSAALAAMTGLPAIAQPLEVSTLAVSGADRISVSPNPTAPHYITDVSGKKVRLVGPRFYPDSARALEFPGRRSNPAVSDSEEALSQQ
ncbi:hypothetical protein KHC17_06095 [Agrobacterium salinitolerans]|uniref:hypothetical protein n=1 Tax=Agrobacterium salinitolerans TaxID=1183413 RepID=UPI001C2360DE|nr:hypothetical protein [Agrobacterium salinitolerans]QXC47921.1 hypothetical protein KHC17_06095 [Agrobacterium salinitolerans]